jgi:hypothetical protein
MDVTTVLSGADLLYRTGFMYYVVVVGGVGLGYYLGECLPSFAPLYSPDCLAVLSLLLGKVGPHVYPVRGASPDQHGWRWGDSVKIAKFGTDLSLPPIYNIAVTKSVSI